MFYDKHMNRKTPCTGDKTISVSVQKDFCCPHCCKPFTSKYNMNRHIENQNISCYISRSQNKTFYKMKDEIQLLKQQVIKETKEEKPKKKLRKVNGYTKKVVASSQDWHCNSCSLKLPANYDVDHIVPLHKNGSNELENLQALCKNCHGEKSIMEQIYT